MKILKTWKQGDVCQEGSPVIALPPQGCGCDNTSICCAGITPFCCFYGAEYWEAGVLTPNDMPNQIFAKVLCNIVNPEPSFECPPNDGYANSIVLDHNGDGTYGTFFSLDDIGNGWGVRMAGDISVGRYQFGPTTIACLFNDESLEINPNFYGYSVRDLFLDTYTGTFVNPDLTPSGLPPLQFTRISLCQWQAFSPTDGFFILEYGDNRNSPDSQNNPYSGWFMNGVKKTNGLGNGQYQNTPTGIYDANKIIVISEP